MLGNQTNQNNPSHPKPVKRIGELLIENEIITQTHLVEALKAQSEKGGKLVEILIALGYLEPARFLRFLSNEGRIPSIQLANYEIPKEIIELVPRDTAIAQEVIPIDKMSKLLTLAMACPLDAKTIAMLETDTGLKIKPVLCSSDDIRAAIKRYYPAQREEASSVDNRTKLTEELKIESSLRLSGVATLIRSIESLPALSKTVHEVREAMLNPSSSAKKIAQIIGQDPGIAAKVLSVANSAAYSFPNKLNDISLAVALIGLSEVYAIVTAASVMDIFNDKKQSLNYKTFWAHSLCTAAAARMIAQHTDATEKTNVFSAGLLHDIGQLALAKVAPSLYEKVDPTLTDLDLIAEEEKVMGITHTEAGYELARRWSLPAVIAEPIRYHHHPDLCQSDTDVVAIVALASKMAHHATSPDFKEDAPIPDSLRTNMAQLAMDEDVPRSTMGWLLTFAQAGLELQ